MSSKKSKTWWFSSSNSFSTKNWSIEVYSCSVESCWICYSSVWFLMKTSFYCSFRFKCYYFRNFRNSGVWARSLSFVKFVLVWIRTLVLTSFFFQSNFFKPQKVHLPDYMFGLLKYLNFLIVNNAPLCQIYFIRAMTFYL